MRAQAEEARRHEEVCYLLAPLCVYLCRARGGKAASGGGGGREGEKWQIFSGLALFDVIDGCKHICGKCVIELARTRRGLSLSLSLSLVVPSFSRPFFPSFPFLHMVLGALRASIWAKGWAIHTESFSIALYSVLFLSSRKMRRRAESVGHR